MKLHYKGKYNGDPSSLPKKEHEVNAVKFKEPTDTKQLALIGNGIAIVCFILFFIPLVFYFKDFSSLQWAIGCALALLASYPHELLHAICFKEDVYLYTNFKQGMLFVVGPERMSKARFVFLSLLPNLVFGFIPYVLAFIFDLKILAVFAALSISCGAGDYLNVFNAMTQMPKGARCYLYEMNSYWYIPNKKA